MTSRRKRQISEDEIPVIAMNMLLHRELHQGHTKSELRDEEYILNSEKFQNAVSEARKRLGIKKLFDTSGEYNHVDHAVALLHRAEHAETDISNECFLDHRRHFFDEVITAYEEAGLSRSWGTYVAEYIVSGKQPKEKVLYIPKTIEVVGVKKEDDDIEITLVLRKGLRYEDYRKAWGAFKKRLGTGERLQKSFADKETTLQMIKDHESGMSYKAITEKYFPNNDPVFNMDRVKKAIQRAKKRYERDT